MKSIFFYGYINSDEKDNINKLIEELDSVSADEDTTFYFASQGGELDVSNMIINIINNLENIDKFKMIPGNYCASSGVDIVLRTKCKKVFVNNTIGTIHLAKTKLDSRELKNKTSYDCIDMVVIDKINKERLEYYKSIGLTKEELEEINNGKDFTFKQDRFIEFCNKAVELRKNEKRKTKTRKNSKTQKKKKKNN